MSKTFEDIVKDAARPARLVDANKLLEELFEAECRPTLRWLREQTARRAIPFVKLGRLVFFDVAKVREALDNQTTGRTA